MRAVLHPHNTNLLTPFSNQTSKHAHQQEGAKWESYQQTYLHSTEEAEYLQKAAADPGVCLKRTKSSSRKANPAISLD